MVRSAEARQKELQQIADYKQLADLVNSKVEIADLLALNIADMGYSTDCRETVHRGNPSLCDQTPE